MSSPFHFIYSGPVVDDCLEMLVGEFPGPKVVLMPGIVFHHPSPIVLLRLYMEKLSRLFCQRHGFPRLRRDATTENGVNTDIWREYGK